MQTVFDLYNGTIIEPGSLDLQFDSATNRWTKVLKLTNRLNGNKKIVYSIKTNIANILNFKGPSKGFLEPTKTAEVIVSVDDQNKAKINNAKIMVTHLQTEEETPATGPTN